MTNETKIYDNTPKTEYKVGMSKDKKWFIHKTIITTIKPAAYIKAMVDSQ